MSVARAPGPLSPSFRSVVAIGTVALVVLLAVGALKGYRDLATARQREHELETRLRETRAEIARLERHIELLKSDPATLELLARDRLMMVKPGETVIVFPREEDEEGVAEPAPEEPPAETPDPLR